MKLKVFSRAYLPLVKMVATFLVLLIASVRSSAFVQIDASPNIVQTKDATLKIGFALQRRLPAGRWLRLTFPKDGMTVSSGLKDCKEQDKQLQFDTCVVNTLENYI